MAVCRLQAAAMAKLESVKQHSATGMQYALEQKKFTDITVSLQPNCVIIPDQGVYRKWDFIVNIVIIIWYCFNNQMLNKKEKWKICSRHT